MRHILFLIQAVTSLLLTNTAIAAGGVLPDFDCLLEPELVVNLSSQVDGVVKTINVDKSDIVNKGQALALIDSEVNEVTVALARARADMENELSLKRNNVDFAQRQLARIMKLYKSSAVSSAQMDEAENELIRTRLELKQAEKKKQVAELELVRAIKAFEQHTIRSPIAGVIVERYLSPGESIDDKPIVKLAQIDPLKVELILPSELFGQIEVGMQAEIAPEAPASGLLKASVTSVDRVIDAASGTFNVRLALPNTDHKIPSGLKCKARIVTMADNTVPATPVAPTDKVTTTPQQGTKVTKVTQEVKPSKGRTQLSYDAVSKAHPASR